MVLPNLVFPRNQAPRKYQNSFHLHSPGQLVKRSAFSMKQTISEKITSVEKPSVRNKNPRISFSKTSELTPIASNLYRCNFNKSEIECRNRTVEFRNKVVSELRKSMSSSGTDNSYNVQYDGKKLNKTVSSITMLLRNNVKMLRKRDKPFNKHKLGALFPRKKLFQKVKGKTCVIVSSAGSLASSNLGEFIGNFYFCYYKQLFLSKLLLGKPC